MRHHFCLQLLWFLPPLRVVTLLPDDWDETQFEPLANFCDS